MVGEAHCDSGLSKVNVDGVSVSRVDLAVLSNIDRVVAIGIELIEDDIEGVGEALTPAVGSILSLPFVSA